MNEMIIGAKQPRVVVVVEGGSRQLIGIYDKDSEVPIHTGEFNLLGPLQIVPAPPQNSGGDGFMMGPIFPLIPVPELLVNASSVFEVELDGKLYQKYFMVAEQIEQVQNAAAAGLSLAREMPRGGPGIGGR